MNAFETVFEIIFIVIMTIGILGLPAYFWLNTRRKRLAQEYEEKQSDNETEE